MENLLPLMPMKGDRQGQNHGKEDEKKTFGNLQGEGALAAMAGGKTLVALAQQFEVHPIQITNCRKNRERTTITNFSNKIMHRINR
ncbi:hypothetical protein HNR65_003587 [Desulfosalsimonas propionicica]|uniref:Uncharacterized protein n=1 Tax=Desulfosalsimonas propionicica TaxID=332175 RepID=A0A7W0CCH8_9BACT|nr:hypothetical protein [Desulfosalsimonas propionicica]